jgi:hypothetical protein
MSSNTRTIILVTAIILILIIGGYFLYRALTPAAQAPAQPGQFGETFPVSGERQIPAGTTSAVPTTTEQESNIIMPPTEIGAVQEGQTGQQYFYRKITPVAIGGAYAFNRASSTIVRFVEKGTGHIFELSDTAATPTEISNTTIPKIQNVYWGTIGSSSPLAIQYLQNKTNDMRILLGTVKTSTSTMMGEINGTIMPRTITDIASSPDGKSIFYIDRGTSGVTGLTSDFANKKTVQIFSSPLIEWTPNWISADTISLTTKPSFSALGTLFWLNVKTGGLTRVLSNINGLTTLTSPDLKSILYSKGGGSTLETFLYVISEKTAYPFPSPTMPEKCVWSRKEQNTIYCGIPKTIIAASYPDVWYQGLISFSDAVWKINTQSENATLMFDPDAENVGSIDAANLLLDPQENYLFFTNKKDGTLWSVKLR